MHEYTRKSGLSLVQNNNNNNYDAIGGICIASHKLAKHENFARTYIFYDEPQECNANLRIGSKHILALHACDEYQCITKCDTMQCGPLRILLHVNNTLHVMQCMHLAYIGHVHDPMEVDRESSHGLKELFNSAHCPYSSQG